MFLSPGKENGGGVYLLAFYERAPDSAVARPARPNRKNELRLVPQLCPCLLKSELPRKHNQTTPQKLPVRQIETKKMASLGALSAQQISKMLDEYGIKHGPVVGE